MRRVGVRASRPEDAARIVDLLTLAFAGDPAARVLMAEPGRYLAGQAIVSESARALGQPHGSALVTEGFEGAALWLPPGVGLDQAALGAIFEGAAPTERFQTALAAFARLSEFKPREPYWYLAVLGVDPIHQGQGVGSALLEHQLAVVDAQHEPAYLETSNPAAVPLYERFGFEIVADLSPEGHGWILLAMQRPAR